jgi:hypothetical protein
MEIKHEAYKETWKKTENRPGNWKRKKRPENLNKTENRSDLKCEEQKHDTVFTG